jgi:hypothetical protein
MIELKSNRLVVGFPEVSPEAVLTIDFQRTLRIPDDGKDYPLPPGLGSFPLRHIDEHAERVPAPWLKRGGVLLPMYQSEALWLNFHSQHVPDRETSYPFAVKVATGKINAATGETWHEGLGRNPQNYLVIPTQPWLDGYCVEKGIIRQFVAMPLGEGYTVEEQLTGEAEVGGVQIEVFPMKKAAFDRRFPRIPRLLYRRRADMACCLDEAPMSAMGLSPGGRMRQEIYEDPYSIHDWDADQRSRCFVHLLNSVGWWQLTGEQPPSKPLSAKEYTASGYPWFDYYDADAKALEGAQALAGIKSVAAMAKEKRGTSLPDNQSVTTPKIVSLRAGLRKGQVREGAF